MCTHVVEWGSGRGPGTSMRVERYYVGHGIDHVLLCGGCADALDDGVAVDTALVCDACRTRVTQTLASGRVRGAPAPFERPEPFDATVTSRQVAGLDADLLDLACAEGPGTWYGLCADGGIVELSADWSARIVARETLRDEPDEPDRRRPPRPRLHVAHSGSYAAVVNDYGRFGRVVDLRDGSEAMSLDAGDGRYHTVPFSLAFAARGGRDLVVHVADWNRLDVSDPATGEVLTHREQTGWDGHGERPPHNLDYFHGALHLSPAGEWLLDDGWIWQPVGDVVAWSLTRWLSDDVWESEDGASRRSLCFREGCWDVGMCWLDDERAAVWGIGDIEDLDLVDGARVFDVTRGTDDDPRFPEATELGAFAGPAGAFFGDGDRLYSAGDDGLSIWDVRTGERTGRIEGFVPARQSLGRGELVEVHARAIAVWRYANAFDQS